MSATYPLGYTKPIQFDVCCVRENDIPNLNGDLPMPGHYGKMRQGKKMAKKMPKKKMAKKKMSYGKKKA